MKNIITKLLKIQAEIKVPKDQKNHFGNYTYRSCEDILEKARPLCNKYGVVLILNDEIKFIEGRFYVVATATIYDSETGESISVTANAREADDKKGMDVSQITGASSSYARKYALSGLFCLDDNKDADTMDNSTATDRNELISRICKKLANNNIDNNIISRLLLKKYNKSNSKQLTVKELSDLDKNIIKYVQEITE